MYHLILKVIFKRHDNEKSAFALQKGKESEVHREKARQTTIVNEDFASMLEQAQTLIASSRLLHCAHLCPAYQKCCMCVCVCEL